jgi:predicted MPP superfamily phosphohydrolase
VRWEQAGIAALLVVVGDLLTSFVKRRLGKESGAAIPLFDQLFEGLLPAWYLSTVLGQAWWVPVCALAIFMPMALTGSRFWKFLLFRPPMANYSRIVRSTVRLKEWRACHAPMARIHVYLHFPDFLYHRLFLTTVFMAMGLYRRGQRNVLAPQLVEQEFQLPGLPSSFDGFRILFLSDLHLDGLKGLTETIIEKISTLSYDLCLIGGDVRMELYGPTAPSLRQLRSLLANLAAPCGVFGVLGNHDCIEMVPDFEEAGMLMLVNDSWKLEKDGQSLWIVGIDDPHYYKVEDLTMAFRKVDVQDCSIFLAHSPEACLAASAYRPGLYLCGHTHGGQIRLPGRGPLITNSRAPRHTAEGRWLINGMQGYTNRGVGASGVPLRFNCPGEITLITIRSPEYDAILS